MLATVLKGEVAEQQSIFLCVLYPTRSMLLPPRKKVAAASKHNLRQYESPQYCRDNIFVLVGGNNILDDLKEAYHQKFDT